MSSPPGAAIVATLDIARFPPRLLARLSGAFSLIGIVAGAFDIGYVHNKLFVDGNPAATVHNILAHPSLFQLGFAAHLLLLLCNIPAEILFFLIIRRVNLVVAAVAMAFGLVGTAIEAAVMLNAWVPVKLAMDTAALGAFTPAQLQALSYTFLHLQEIGLLISFVFYGTDEILEGFLIFRSSFLPRVIGVLLAVAGACYLTHGFLYFIAPQFDARLYPYILFPCLPGEGSTALWLAIVGLNVARWQAFTTGPRMIMPSSGA